MNRGRRLAALLIVVIVVLGALGAGIALVTRTPSTTLKQAVAVPANFTNTAPFGSNTIVLGNGRSLVNYNYTSGETTVLSADDINSPLSAIDSISASKNQQYILFHSAVNTAGVLADTLNQQHLDTSSDYWWVYSLQSKQFTPLPAGSLSASFNGSNVQTLAYNGGQEFITTFALPSLQQTAQLSIPLSTAFVAVQGGYLLTSSKGQVYFTKDGIINQTVFTNAQLVGVSSDGRYAFATQVEGNDQSLVRYDVTTHKLKRVAGAITGTPIVTSDGAVLYTTQAKAGQSVGLHRAGIADLSVTNIELSGIPDSDSQNVKLLSAPSSSSVIISTGADKFYMAGNTVHTVPLLRTDYTSSFTVAGATRSLVYYPDQSAIVATINLSSTGERAAAYAQLQHDGLDPDLVPLIFTQVTSDSLED